MFKIIEKPNGKRILIKETVVGTQQQYRQLMCVPQPKPKLLYKNTHKKIGNNEYLPDQEIQKWIEQNKERIQWI